MQNKNIPFYTIPKSPTSPTCFSLTIRFHLELCCITEVSQVAICFTTRKFLVLSRISDVMSFTYQTPLKFPFLFCQQPNETCGNVFAVHKPPLSSRIPCSSYTAQINLSSRHKSIFFSSQVSHTHTHTGADSALRADTCWPQSPTPLLHSLFHHPRVKVLKRLRLSVCLSDGPQSVSLPWAAALSAGRDASLELLADQYYTGLKLDLQSDKSTSAAISPTHNPLKIYFFPLS